MRPDTARMILFFVFLAGACGAAANDRWDAGAPFCGNDGSAGSLCNQLLHARPQEHDVQSVSPTRDLDYMVVETKARHSYEVVLHSASTVLGNPTAFPATGWTRAYRVDSGGGILAASFPPDGPFPFSDSGLWTTIRWIGGANDQRDWIRVEGMNVGNPTSNSSYVIELLDTTYFVPRFNNSGSQVTVFLIQNTTPVAVAGSIYFHNAAGTLLHTEPLNVPVRGLQVFPTSSIGALNGLSGSAMIAHTGGYGALAGKAVALEPATGFSFDTQLVPVPR